MFDVFRRFCPLISFVMHVVSCSLHCILRLCSLVLLSSLEYLNSLIAELFLYTLSVKQLRLCSVIFHVKTPYMVSKTIHVFKQFSWSVLFLGPVAMSVSHINWLKLWRFWPVRGRYSVLISMGIPDRRFISWVNVSNAALPASFHIDSNLSFTDHSYLWQHC